MKKMLLLFCFAAMHAALFSTSDPYSEAMKTGLDMLDSAASPDELMAAANHFSRIADVEKARWQPAYYTAYAYAMMASSQSDPKQIDPLLDVSEKYLDQATKLEHDQSEVLVLRGFVHMARIAVDPSTRGQMYSGMSAAALQKAQKINPNNPRVMHFLAQLSFGTAQFFGTDTSAACQLNDQSIEMFKTTANASLADPFAPKWGLTFAESFKARCVN